MEKRINIAWLKRDLRICDNQVLQVCEDSNISYEIIYIFDPIIIKQDNLSYRHLQFIYHSIIDINDSLRKYNRTIKCFYGPSHKIFQNLIRNYDINNIYAYQETGILETFNRDKRIRKMSNDNNINFIEFEKDGVIRGLRNREGWDQRWFKVMNTQVVENSFSQNVNSIKINDYPLPEPFLAKISKYSNYFVKPGYKNAMERLESFVDSGSSNYTEYISKPYESRKSCSRISPYLSWGNISSKQIYQFLKNKKKKKGIRAFLTRLKWRSHFIQKFESEYQISYRCANKAFEKMPYDNNLEIINYWKSGKTGFPLIDANMHCLKKTGWINFRMRAMLVSILAHQFNCSWKLGAKHLAMLFLDYEPGIHFSQFQMQAGTTGINTIRMYNPIKQSYDHDPNGIFIKKWIPELRNFDIEYIHEPWKAPPFFNTLDKDSIYNHPCINLEQASKKARSKIWSFKASKEVKLENKRILKLHVRGRS